MAAVEASLSYHRCPILGLLLRNNGRVATVSSAAVLYSPQKPSPMDGLNLASRQRDVSFWQQQSCLPSPLSLSSPSRWMKLSKLSPSLPKGRAAAGRRKVCSGGKKSALSGKEERRARERERVTAAAAAAAPRYDTIGFLLNKVEWPPRGVERARWKRGRLKGGRDEGLG